MPKPRFTQVSLSDTPVGQGSQFHLGRLATGLFIILLRP